jgi:carbonic anhydrase
MNMQSSAVVLAAVVLVAVVTITATLLIVPADLWASEDQASEGQEWGYEGEHGPEHWGELADEFDICSRGRNQSPIDIVVDAHADLPELRFDYRVLGRLNEINTGHAIQDAVIPGNYLWILENSYELKQFHFHSPSEHLIDGEEFPMEIHMVHQNDAGDYAVIGLLVEEGVHNEIMDELPSFRAERGLGPREVPVDFNELIPNRKEYFYYNGSLTTPPCTEGVTWIIIKKPLIASPLHQCLIEIQIRASYFRFGRSQTLRRVS